MMTDQQDVVWSLLKRYDRKIIATHPEHLKCAICHKVIIEAYQGNCGCKYCKECIEALARTKKSSCPGNGRHCKQNVIKSIGEFSRDFRINVEVMELGGKCPNDRCDFAEELFKLPNHLKTCPKLPVTCPYSSMGCTHINLTNDTIEEHLRTDMHKHATKMCQFQLEVNNKITSLHGELDKSKRQNSVLEATLNSVKGEVIQQKTQIHGLEKELRDAKGRIDNVNNNNDRITAEMQNTKTDIELIWAKFKELEHEMVARLQKIDDRENKKENSSKKMIEDQKKDMAILKQEVTKVVKLKTEVDTSIKKFYTHFQSLNGDLMKLNYGEYVWAIDHFSERRQMAANGGDEVICSSSFYSHKNGYKLRLKCFPDGVLNLKGEYMCLSFYVLKGDFDDILEWPMLETISLSIIDQKGKDDYERKEFSHDTVAEGDRHVFNRQWANNVGFGSMNFAKIDCLLQNNSVLLKDTLYIRCTIRHTST